MGILYLTIPYFSLEKQAIETKALIGPVTRKWEFSSPDDLICEDGKIFINTDGKRKKVGISRWLAEQQDWNAFLQAIEQMKKSEGLEKQPYAQRSVG